MGKLIVIEGCDGSGKATQARLLQERLKEKNLSAVIIDFPCYDEDSSLFVRQYLAGEFGNKPEDVNAYAASVFYAVDRYVSFKKVYSRLYEEGAVFVANRYTTANAVHQTQKLEKEEWEKYLSWLFDFEYNKLLLPIPDLVLYLDLPSTISEGLLLSRYEGDSGKMDIHEKDIEFQKRSREAALYCAKREGWKVIDCSEGNAMRTRESISDEIYGIIESYIFC